uniref:poly(ADP-ribose) glycohydrolase n=1 Tax=Salix viminalis TaxID=40686 RepID=A0A6N2L9D5_SALVM
MENREDLKSMLPFLPLLLRSSNLFWPSQVVESLKTLSKGPLYSKVNSGELLFITISNIRDSLALPSLHRLSPYAHEGYGLFFDELISREEAAKWFADVVPGLANFLLRLPSLLESHYHNADNLLNGVKTGFRLLGPQDAGVVFLGQENKIKCIIHYFERICLSMPEGSVSFERKILPSEQLPLCVSYPKADFWIKSVVSLCTLEVHSSGFIEDQSSGALEVDFSNKYLGGGALHRGCVQEEIRFMINPELIAGMLFLPCMEDNEAIEIVGAERFSNYTGYASSFRFSGDYVDKRDVDSFRRRRTRIVAIDALCNAGLGQYELKYLLRETNKAFCGFLDQSKCDHKRLFRDGGLKGSLCIQADRDGDMDEAPSTSVEIALSGEESVNQVIRYSDKKGSWCEDPENKIGIATGNWGCGAFGGDPEIKTIVQWLAASQALRPSVSYYTCGLKSLQNLNQLSQWISLHGWTVGDLWNMLVEYSSQRFNRETNLGFFAWLLPSLFSQEAP